MKRSDHIDLVTQARSTALVSVAPQPYFAERCTRYRHDPSFVTQLIAVAQDLPHTRQRRRAALADAVAAYAGPMPIGLGRTRRIV